MEGRNSEKLRLSDHCYGGQLCAAGLSHQVDVTWVPSMEVGVIQNPSNARIHISHHVQH